MTPDKKPEEILKEQWSKVTDRPFGEMELQHLNYAILAMQEYADQEKRKAFNEALDLAAENAKTRTAIYYDTNDPECERCRVNKQSILNLKQK